MLTLGESIALALLVGLVSELGVFLYGASGMLLCAPTQEEDIKGESREYNLRALTIGGLSFASITLLFTVYHKLLPNITDVLLLLTLSLGLLFVSYSVEVLARIRRIFWVVQDKTLGFGYLAIVFAFLVFFREIIPIAMDILLPFTVIIIVLHVYEFTLDFQKWSQQEQARKVKKRP